MDWEAHATEYARVEPPAKGSIAAALELCCPGRYAVLFISIAVFLVQYSQSQAMIAPFIAASRPGQLIGESGVGIVFSAYPFATAVATPLPPLVLRHLGLRGMVVLGLTLCALANLAFGIAGSYADSFEHMSVLMLCLIAARSVGGIGAALSEAGCLTAVTTSGWGPDLGKVLGYVEMTTGIGAALGAALGGWLFHAGGFFLPMCVGSALPLVVLPLVGSSLPTGDPGAEGEAEAAEEDGEANGSRAGDGDGDGDGSDARGPARNAARFATCTSLFFAAVVFEGLNPLLEPHLKLQPYRESVPEVGMLLSAICLVYTMTALPAGWLTDGANQGKQAGCRLRSIMLCGWALTLIAAFLLSPGGGGGEEEEDLDRSSDALDAAPARGGESRPPSLWFLPVGSAQIALAFAIPALGAGAALVIIPSLPDMQRGLKGSEAAAVCALWNGAYAGGSAVGPLISTIMFARRGWAAVVVAQGVISIGLSTVLVAVSALPHV